MAVRYLPALLIHLFIGSVALFLSSCLSLVTHNEQSIETSTIPQASTIPLTGSWKIRPGSLAPANLYLPTVDDSAWKDIQVPANWALRGEDYSGAVWYRRHFTPDPRLQNKVVQLVFEGVDYAADVWLNGHYLGFHEGYFQPFRFVVSQQLRFGEDNILAVRVDSPYEEPGRSWSFYKRLIKGVFNHHDTRPGGAWSIQGQDRNTGGIWAPVLLRVSDALTLDALHITPRLPSDGSDAVAEVQVTVTSMGQQEKEVSIDLTLTPHNFSADEPSGGHQRETVRLTPGTHHLTFTVPCQHPRLWWTWEHGEPNLYKLQVDVSDKTARLDTGETTFGFRTIDYEPASQTWRLNGKRLFLRGTNYIATQWLSEMTPEKYALDLSLMKQANINIIRVHAHIEALPFYRLCDEVGILVWQDFPLQWGYTDDPAFAEEAVRQAKDMIALLYNHPAIIVWSLHNEPPWDASWMQYKYPEYIPTHNRQLDDTLFEQLRGVDTTRHLHPYSATSEHPWYGWYSGSWQDYGKPAPTPLITEFGAQALPDVSSLRKIFSESDLWPTTKKQWELWEYHNFQKRETFEIAKVPQGRTLEEFIANTQHYQANLIKFAAESYRRQKFRPVTAIFQFMFVESWPSINWGIVDYWRQPKPGYLALQTAYQPVLPSIAWSQDVWKQGETVRLPIWVINDLWTAFAGARLHCTLRTTARTVAQANVTFEILPDSAKEVMIFQSSTLRPDSYELLVEVRSAEGHPLGANQFRFTVKK